MVGGVLSVTVKLACKSISLFAASDDVQSHRGHAKPTRVPAAGVG